MAFNFQSACSVSALFTFQKELLGGGAAFHLAHLRAASWHASTLFVHLCIAALKAEVEPCWEDVGGAVMCS